MWKIDQYYHSKIKPIINDAILDYLDLGNDSCPDYSDIDIDYSSALAGHLFLNDDEGWEAIETSEIKLDIKHLLCKEGHQEIIIEEFIGELDEQIVAYYADTINELLHYEFEEIYHEHQDGLREEYEYDKEC